MSGYKLFLFITHDFLHGIPPLSGHTKRYVVILQNFGSFLYQLVAHIVAEIPDMCLTGLQAKSISNPSVSFLAAEDSLSPELVENLMGLDAFLTECAVRQGAFRQGCSLMDSYIGITGRIVAAYIDLSPDE